MTSKIIMTTMLLSAVLWASDNTAVLGVWEGESLCTIKDSPCHDEHVIYHIKPDAKDPSKLELSANKVVNGEELYMGSLECMFAAEKQELNCHYRKDDLWNFKVSGDSMTGTLILPENKLYRRISVQRKKQDSPRPR